jgi:hypothetical protein
MIRGVLFACPTKRPAIRIDEKRTPSIERRWTRRAIDRLSTDAPTRRRPDARRADQNIDPM